MRSIFSKTLLIAALTMMHGGCIENETKKAQSVVTPSAQRTASRVAPRWQKDLIDAFQKSEASNGYILVSESSYAHAGQFLVLDYNSKQTAIIAPPGAESAKKEASISGSTWKSLKAAIQTGQTLDNIEQSFMDGTRYEFLHIEQATPPRVKKRLLIAVANFDKDTQDYERLVSQFQNLAKEVP